MTEVGLATLQDRIALTKEGWVSNLFGVSSCRTERKTTLRWELDMDLDGVATPLPQDI